MDYKISFISPKAKDRNVYKYHPRLSPYTSAVLASLVPSNWEPKIVDENVESINFNDDADLVAITAFTSAAPRAYEIAEEFKERGVPSLLGNIHPTVLPNEAMKYGTVVAREGENIFPEILKSYEKGVLKKFYDGGHVPSLNTPNLPRFDLFNKRYEINLIQYSRGCPNNCDFCSVSTTSGHQRRHKTQQRFVDEINASRVKVVTIADDNFLGNTRADTADVKSLLRKVKDETDIIWTAQVTVDFAKDDELLKLASESGCFSVLMGLETVNPYSLKETGKAVNYKKDYKKIIKKIHDNGIGVVGTFIYGFDNDRKDVFSKTVDFVKDTEIDNCRFEILTPLPGTRLEKRLRNEGRIFLNNYPEDWSLYNCTNVVFHPKNMTAEELEVGTLESIRETSNPLSTAFRFVKSLVNTRNIYGAGSSAYVNASFGLHARDKLRERNGA